MLRLVRLKVGMSGMAAPNGAAWLLPNGAALGKAPPSGAAFLPLGFQSQREGSAGGNPHGGKTVDAEEKRKELEIDRIEAETAKLKAETNRMVLSNNLDKVKLVLTAAAATAAVAVALESIGIVGGA